MTRCVLALYECVPNFLFCFFRGVGNSLLVGLTAHLWRTVTAALPQGKVLVPSCKGIHVDRQNSRFARCKLLSTEDAY